MSGVKLRKDVRELGRNKTEYLYCRSAVGTAKLSPNRIHYAVKLKSGVSVKYLKYLIGNDVRDANYVISSFMNTIYYRFVAMIA